MDRLYKSFQIFLILLYIQHFNALSIFIDHRRNSDSKAAEPAVTQQQITKFPNIQTTERSNQVKTAKSKSLF